MYKVEWSKEVLAKIAAAWEGSTADEREAIHVAAEMLDAILLDEPETAGESRESDRFRVLLHMPLVISYRIDSGNHRVRVFSVNIYRRDR
jgi:hypothetical protein